MGETLKGKLADDGKLKVRKKEIRALVGEVADRLCSVCGTGIKGGLYCVQAQSRGESDISKSKNRKRKYIKSSSDKHK